MGTTAEYWVEGIHVGCRMKPTASIPNRSAIISAIVATVNPYTIASGRMLRGAEGV
jgi:hypothetical protein